MKTNNDFRDEDKQASEQFGDKVLKFPTQPAVIRLEKNVGDIVEQFLGKTKLEDHPGFKEYDFYIELGKALVAAFKLKGIEINPSKDKVQYSIGTIWIGNNIRIDDIDESSVKYKKVQFAPCDASKSISEANNLNAEINDQDFSEQFKEI